MDRISVSSASPRPLQILSLGKARGSKAAAYPIADATADGGGIRGISSLLILEDIMERIREVHRLDYTPRPCEYFDLIGGTSTGGQVKSLSIHQPR